MGLLLPLTKPVPILAENERFFRRTFTLQAWCAQTAQPIETKPTPNSSLDSWLSFDANVAAIKSLIHYNNCEVLRVIIFSAQADFFTHVPEHCEKVIGARTDFFI